jgi:endonuclease/exonuclease/phosphatase family metal-dependent hydrolase
MRKLTVATFNIRHGLGRDGRIDLARSAAAVRDCGAGFVALQEVDSGLARSGRLDQAAEIARLTGMHARFFSVLTRARGHYGLGLVADAPVGARYVELPRVRPDEEPRGAIVAWWRGVSVVTTHLSLVRESRLLQTGAVAELATAVRPPVIVLGDLNQRRDELAALLDAGLDPGPGEHATFKGRLGGRQIDFVLAGRGAAVRRTWTIDSSASDHLPLVAEVELVD